MSKNTLVGAGAAVLGEALLACKTLADLFSAIQAYKTYDNYPPVEQFENLELEYTDPNNNVKCTNCGRGFNV